MSLAPDISERVCPVSFEVARIRLGGGPDSRPSFWKVYREELALNLKTEFHNEHVRICRNLLAPAFQHLSEPHYYRNGRLVTEKSVPTAPSR